MYTHVCTQQLFWHEDTIADCTLCRCIIIITFHRRRWFSDICLSATTTWRQRSAAWRCRWWYPLIICGWILWRRPTRGAAVFPYISVDVAVHSVNDAEMSIECRSDSKWCCTLLALYRPGHRWTVLRRMCHKQCTVFSREVTSWTLVARRFPRNKQPLDWLSLRAWALLNFFRLVCQVCWLDRRCSGSCHVGGSYTWNAVHVLQMFCQ